MSLRIITRRLQSQAVIISKRSLSHSMRSSRSSVVLKALNASSTISSALPQLASPVCLPNFSIARRNFRTSSPSLGVIPFNLADIGEGIVECAITQWFVKEGDHVREFDKICEVESDKAAVEITSRFTGVIRKLHYKKGEMAKVGKPLIDIEIEGDTAVDSKSEQVSESSSQQQQQQQQQETPKNGDLKSFATPAVRRIAKENDIDITMISGTGKDGRVMKEDVIRFIEGKGKGKVEAPKAAPVTPVAEKKPEPVVSEPVKAASQGGVRREQVKGFTRSMIKTMNESWRKIPHFGLCEEIEMNQLIELRNEMKEVSLSRNIKLSYMPFFIKAASLALKQYPILNCSLSDDEQEIIYKDFHNIGIAMDTPNGLIVPNIKNVQEKSIFEIAAELNRLQEIGSKGQLSRNDLTGGTFTLSNVGTIGGTYTKPVIVSPEVCIGALGKMTKVPRYNKKNEIYPSSIINISWSADHRVIDGATMARFCNAWKMYLENPKTMFMDLK